MICFCFVLFFADFRHYLMYSPEENFFSFFCYTSLSSFFIRTIQDHCVYWHTAELCSFALIALHNKPFFKENIGVTTSINFQKVNTSQTQKLSEYIIYIHVPVFDMS